MRKHVLSLILLAVLIPLVNLGPSLHHLSCFGLHCGCESSLCELERGCCDGHASQECGVAKRVPVRVLSVFADSDCPLCKFFAHYNAIDCQHSLAVLIRGCSGVTEEILPDPFSESVPEQARGPPIRSFV